MVGLGVIGSLPQIKDDDAYRISVDFINIGEGSATIEIRVYDSDGE